jgi:hypothetical protein
VCRKGRGGGYNCLLQSKAPISSVGEAIADVSADGKGEGGKAQIRRQQKIRGPLPLYSLYGSSCTVLGF